MRALVLAAENEFPKLQDVPQPDPKPGEVLVRVGAAGINYADTMMRRGFYIQKPQFPYIPGFEFSGVVEYPNGSRFKVGDRVMGTCGSGYAEYVTVREAGIFSVPATFSDEEAAAFPVVYLTAMGMLRLSADAKAGQTILIHAAAGGVGTAGIQLSKALGLRVIATASSSAKLELAKGLGADVLINYKETDFVDPVLVATGGRGVDVTFESIGGDFVAKSVQVTAPFGKVVVFGNASNQLATPDIGAMYRNSIGVYAFWMATLAKEPELIGRVSAELLALVDGHGIKPVVGKVYALQDGAQAMMDLESRSTTGKLVLKP